VLPNDPPFNLVFAPPDQPKANACEAVPALIEGIISPPHGLGLRGKGAPEALYTREHLSAREVSRIAGASRSGVLKALDRFSIPRSEDTRRRIGPLCFGFDYLDHQLVKNGAEQAYSMETEIREMFPFDGLGIKATTPR
jgi:hypothetical protein